MDVNPLEAFNLVSSFNADVHSIEFYSEQPQFTIGYNQLFFRIKDNATEEYITNAQVSWKPMMHMTEMSHSCPKTTIVKGDDDSVYFGSLVFQMPGNEDNYWEITLDYTIDGQAYSITERIEVKAPADTKRRVNVFMGSDEKKYVLALVPFAPEMAVNDISAVLYKMENMIDFSLVEDYTIAIDPRMPSMGNHSSPNNVDLGYDVTSGMYQGQLSLTMSGYWKINLKLLNENGEALKGEDVTEENEASSLFFEVEF